MTDQIAVLHRQAQQALNQQDYRLAHQCLIKILALDKYFADGYFLLGIIASCHNNLTKSIQLIEQAHLLQPDNSEYIGYLAKHYALNNQAVLAKNTLDKLTQLPITSAIVLDTIGVAFSRIGLHRQAVDYFQQAVKLKPTNQDFQFNLAASLKFSGKFQQARAHYQQTIALNPHHYKAHAALSSLGGITAENNHLEQLTLLFNELTNADDKLYIGHAMAREYEALKDFDNSFAALVAAKADKLSSLDYSLQDDQTMFDSIMAMFANDHDKLFNANSHNTNKHNHEAIFVVGMPRTGTTLVERILSNHQAVTSAGELQNFGLLFKQFSQSTTHRVIDAETVAASHAIDFEKLGQAYLDSTRVLTGKTAKFVDKMPLNVLYAGFIIQALPNAKIICLDRNPLDTVLSNFKQLFSVNQSYYNYAYSLTWTAEFYLLFKKLADFWQQKFPDNFYLVNYETLVNQPEAEAKKLLHFCDLSWQPSCLNIVNNQSPVATASAVQVRQPINNKSVGYWQNYQKHLAEVITKLT